MQGLSILRSEVEAALREMKKGKAMGEDGKAVEILLILGQGDGTSTRQGQGYVTRARAKGRR